MLAGIFLERIVRDPCGRTEADVHFVRSQPVVRLEAGRDLQGALSNVLHAPTNDVPVLEDTHSTEWELAGELEAERPDCVWDVARRVCRVLAATPVCGDLKLSPYERHISSFSTFPGSRLRRLRRRLTGLRTICEHAHPKRSEAREPASYGITPIWSAFAHKPELTRSPSPRLKIVVSPVRVRVSPSALCCDCPTGPTPVALRT